MACSGVSFSSWPRAIEVLEQRKKERFGEGQVRLETYSLAVVDRNGIAPQKEFHAVRVLAGDTQFLAHSVVKVVTSEGDLFYLEWCLD